MPAASCTDLSNNPLSTDARGVSRPRGSACDIGAVER
ncbi:choice-of-anchor Q domain-containing protein [Meiothermus rufus]|nr:choice-of-anchor Q domain-containing protein [Meiothermus rufus]